MKGFVYLVGAGPGDPGLLTLKGKEALEKAEAVIYDYLVHTDLLAYAPEGAILEWMGKQGHGVQRSQDDITARVIELAEQGLRVVRLKGGDPTIFGRMGEEALAITEAGIPVEIIPGVTAASGAAAYAGIPLTHRDYAPCVTFVTGHRRKDGGLAPNIDWAALGKAGGTLAIYMGIKHLGEVAEKLIASGRSPDTPIVVVHRATWPEQKVLEATLSTVSERVKDAAIPPPSLVIVGEVAKARSHLGWFEKSPLKGKQILVTRAASQARELCHLLQERGAMPIELPLIELKPYGHKSGTEATLRKIFAYDWVIFSSYNAVKFTFARLEEMGLDSRVFGAARVCAVGPKTAAALEKHGIRPDMVPEKYIAESMVESFETVGGLDGASVLIPRAREAREVVPEGLERMGARVDILPIYENVMPEPHPLALEVVKGGKIDVVTLASPSAAINYAELLKNEGLPVDLAPCAVIGPATQSKAEELGLPVVAVAETYTVEGMVLALEGYLAKK
ncbi:MAG: uroporphyrinogen-III C-methyltransferase [Deltaproteobacteria bacterium]|mgnify:CR=1 FL=1|nr:MAG: uroporphyrinogen-III C-methyltransferase [Deltaproteobacteria bacterium]